MLHLNLKNLSDDTLLTNTKLAVKKETEQMLLVLHHLKEVDRRRLYSHLKCESLKEYCIKELKYSETSAIARIDAMRALRELPEIEEKIEGGKITLSNIVLAQKYFRREEKLGKVVNKAEKAKVFLELENKSARTAEKLLMAKNPEHIQFEEKIRRLNPEYLEFRCTVTDAFLEKLAQVKGMLAHKLPKASNTEILERALEMVIELLTPKTPEKSTRSTSLEKQPTSEKGSSKACEANHNLRNAQPTSESIPSSTENPNQISHVTKNIQAIPAPIKREVRERAQNKCENCNSHYALEFEHIHPRAKGGTNNLENIKLLCRNCNARAAIVAFGANTMEQYLFTKIYR